MNQYDLQIFLRTADLLHFGRAAQQCNVSASALSRVIQRLEDEVGAQLFRRDNRSVATTVAGEHFREFARRTLAEWEQLHARFAQQQPGLVGDLSVFASVTAAYALLPAVMARFRAEHPAVTIHLRTGDAEDAPALIRAGEVDIGVAALPETVPAGLSWTPILVTPLVFVAPRGHRLAARRSPAAPDDFRDQPIILPERGLARSRLTAWFGASGVRPRTVIQVSGSEAIVALANLDVGVGVVPRLVLEMSPIRDRLVEIAVTPQLQSYRVGPACRANRRERPVIAAFFAAALGESAGYGKPAAVN